MRRNDEYRRGPNVVAVMGSYHKGGSIDTVVSEVLTGAREAGARTRKIDLIDQRVYFCRNCRECCREPGESRGRCIQHDDDANAIFSALEGADAIVLGAPVNFGDVNALTRTLLERMIGHSYWPADRLSPRVRDPETGAPAVLVTSSAAPALFTRLFARPLRTLRQIARLLGARPVGTLVVGLAGKSGFRPADTMLRKARNLGHELALSTFSRPAGERATRLA